MPKCPDVKDLRRLINDTAIEVRACRNISSATGSAGTALMLTVGESGGFGSAAGSHFPV
jgi:hypothetical protein